jgi:hypothetical protein
MSYLLMDLLWLAGTVPWLWNPGVVGVLATGLTGEGCAKVAVELPEETSLEGVWEKAPDRGCRSSGWAGAYVMQSSHQVSTYYCFDFGSWVLAQCQAMVLAMHEKLVH